MLSRKNNMKVCASEVLNFVTLSYFFFVRLTVESCSQWNNLLMYDPLFYRVKNDPEFQKIGNEIDSKAQVEHERVKKWLEANNLL
jgi:hypothetical protein